MKRLPLAVCESCLPVQGPDAVCQTVRDAGLDGVALEMGHIRTGLALSDAALQQAYLAAADRCGVTLCGLALNTFDKYTLTRPQDAENDAVVRDALRRTVQTAAAMGLPVIQVPSFFANSMQTGADIQATAGYFRWMCDLAADAGVVIGSENGLDVPGNLALLAMVDRPNFKVYFDTENVVFFNIGQPHQMLRQLGRDNICQIHVKDGTAEALSSRRLGDGHGCFNACMQAIAEMGYDGWLVLENSYATPAALAEDARILRAACEV